jgi:hypothetical protein
MIKELTKKLNNKYGIRHCKCGEQLVPHKKLFKNVIIYTCPKSNIFNKKNHSISKAYFIDSPTLKFGTIINKLK